MFVSVQIAALESELMQLMKQNSIQVNNNNNNSVNSHTQLSERTGAPQCPERRLTVGGEPWTHSVDAVPVWLRNSFITVIIVLIVFKEDNLEPDRHVHTQPFSTQVLGAHFELFCVVSTTKLLCSGRKMVI